MNTFNKATIQGGEIKWVNLLHVMRTYCVCECVLERERLSPGWAVNPRDQGHVPFSSSMNLSSVSENEIKRFIL